MPMQGMPCNTNPKQTAATPQLLTPTQLAREINTTPQTINNWHRAGIIPARIAVGRVVRFDRSEAFEALAAQSRKKEVSK